MALRAPAIAVLALLGGAAVGHASEPEGRAEGRSLTIRGAGGETLARVPLGGETFAVSYRNSIYGTLAEERYRALPGARYRLVEIAADQLAVIEEYYAVPGPPRRTHDTDRRRWVAPPDPSRPLVLEQLSIAATDLGERTLHVPGRPPLELWRLVEDERPFIVLIIEEHP